MTHIVNNFIYILFTVLAVFILSAYGIKQQHLAEVNYFCSDAKFYDACMRNHIKDHDPLELRHQENAR